MRKEIKTQSHTVVEQIALQTYIKLLGTLPLYHVVTDICQLRANG